MNADNFSDLVARIEDLPYYTSPPIQVTYTQQATLTLGQYPFTKAKGQMGFNVNVTDNSLWYIRALSFSADIPEVDYQQALQLAGGTNAIPVFQMFFSGQAHVPMLRNALQLNQYFRDLDYKLLVMPKILPNVLKGNIFGTLQQTAALAGINVINATIEVYIQEITDDNFIRAVTKDYPFVMRGNK